MGKDVKLGYDKYNQDKFTTPDEHTKKINGGNDIFIHQKPGSGKLNMPTDLSQEKKNSGRESMS
jgi:hypothetical protein